MGCKMVKGKKSKTKDSAKSIAQEPLELREIDVELLNRKELQAHCKKYGIKAIGKTSELRESLKKLVLSKEQTNIDENQNEITSSSDNVTHSDRATKTNKPGKSKAKEQRIKKFGSSKTLIPTKHLSMKTLGIDNEDTTGSPRRTDESTTVQQHNNSSTFNTEGENDTETSRSAQKLEPCGDVCREESSTDVPCKSVEVSPPGLSDSDVHVDEDQGYNNDADNLTTANSSSSSLCDKTKSFSDEIINNNAFAPFTTNSNFLNQTFSKSQNVSPRAKKRDATFILEKSVVKDHSTPNQPSADSTSTETEDNGSSHTEGKATASPQTKLTTLCTHWCVVDGSLKQDNEVSWKLIKLKGGRPVVPNRFGKYIQFVLEPSVLAVPADFRDNFICGSCVKDNERMHGDRQSGKNSTISTTSETNPKLNKEKENTVTPLTAFTRHQTRASVKRKRVKEQPRPSSVDEPVIQISKRQRKNPASPVIRKARGEKLDLPRNHKKAWRPKRVSRSSTPVTEDASFAEKVETIIQTTVAGSAEELQLIMARKSRVQRSPTKS